MRMVACEKDRLYTGRRAGYETEKQWRQSQSTAMGIEKGRSHPGPSVKETGEEAPDDLICSFRRK